jgi:hypothetical protein
LDLNEVLTKNKQVLELCKTQGFRQDLPTRIVCKALMVYMIPDAVQLMMDQLLKGEETKEFHPATRYCIVDSLAKVGIEAIAGAIR